MAPGSDVDIACSSSRTAPVLPITLSVVVVVVVVVVAPSFVIVPLSKCNWNTATASGSVIETACSSSGTTNRAFCFVVVVGRNDRLGSIHDRSCLDFLRGWYIIRHRFRRHDSHRSLCK